MKREFDAIDDLPLLTATTLAINAARANDGVPPKGMPMALWTAVKELHDIVADLQKRVAALEPKSPAALRDVTIKLTKRGSAKTPRRRKAS